MLVQFTCPRCDLIVEADPDAGGGPVNSESAFIGYKGTATQRTAFTLSRLPPRHERTRLPPLLQTPPEATFGY